VYWFPGRSVADGDKAVNLLLHRLRHVQQGMVRHPANHQPIKWVGNAMFKISDGKVVVKNRLRSESLRFLQQLGARIPTPPEPVHDFGKPTRRSHTIQSWNFRRIAPRLSTRCSSTSSCTPERAAQPDFTIRRRDAFKNWAAGFLTVDAGLHCHHLGHGLRGRSGRHPLDR